MSYVLSGLDSLGSLGATAGTPEFTTPAELKVYVDAHPGSFYTIVLPDGSKRTMKSRVKKVKTGTTSGDDAARDFQKKIDAMKQRMATGITQAEQERRRVEGEVPGAPAADASTEAWAAWRTQAGALPATANITQVSEWAAAKIPAPTEKTLMDTLKENALWIALGAGALVLVLASRKKK